jgi:hypothetical protein
MLSIKGQVYVPVETGTYTLAYDLYMQNVLQAADIGGVMANPPDDGDQALQAVIEAIVRTNQIGAFLAGLLKPADAPWSVEHAKILAPIIDNVTERQLKDQLMAVLVGGMASFFGAGPRS